MSRPHAFSTTSKPLAASSVCRSALAGVIFGALAALPTPTLGAPFSDGLERRLVALGQADSVDVILELADRADLAAFPGHRGAARAVIAELRARAERSQGPLRAFLAARGYGSMKPFWITNSVAVRVAVADLDALARRPELARIEFDEPVRLVGDPRVATGSPEWNVAIIRADQAWKAHGLDGNGIVVGSMDTGFDPGHPAIAGKWRGGAHAWRDFVNGQSTPYDDHGHGTHTLGTVLGGDGPGPFSPDVGIAHGATFLAAKVLDHSMYSTASVVIAGAQWLLDPDGDAATDDFPHVINNSWGFLDPNFTAFHPAAAAWRAAGIFPVFAIGNSGPSGATTISPGNYDNVFAVGATTAQDDIAAFSSRGPSPSGDIYPPDGRKPEVSAPGEGVLSSLPGGGYAAWSGTSMAAPHVSGAIALMLQEHGGPMSFDEVRTALIGTAVDRGAPGYDHDYGHGRLDVLGAVEQAVLPSVRLTAVATGRDVHLSWNASASPGLLRYDVHRSPRLDDPAPPWIASTNDTTFTDTDRFGPVSYRVKPVHASAPSPFTNEVGVLACGMTPPATWVAGATTTSPVAADFDGDGRLDVALANTTASGTVTVALGNGAGGFGASASFPSGGRPMGLVTGDFDEDGVPDLAVANNLATGTVAVLIGHGDGTFAPPVAYAAHQQPVALAVGDFDQDGIADLAVANFGFNDVSILRGGGSGGVGDGTFLPAVHHAAGSRPNAIATADLDEDGALDLAVVNNGSGRVSILRGGKSGGHADGTFGAAASYPCGAGAWAVATGDFDDDGSLDLAVTLAATAGAVAVLRGLGDGTFAAPVLHAAGPFPNGIATADMNGDGLTDLCVVNALSEGTVSVLLGTGTGGVADGGFETRIPLLAGTLPSDLVAADVDGNQVPDVVVASQSGQQNLALHAAACGPNAGVGVHVVTPNGGESWPASTSHEIAWTQEPGVVAVDVEVSRDGGATWETLARDWTGTSFPWFVNGPTSGAARIRVRDARVSSTDASDAGFTIAPDVRLDAPAPRLAPGLALERSSLGRLVVRLTLPDHAAATLEVVDVTGRRIAAHDVGGLGSGTHVRDLGRDLPAGIYWVRLVRGDARIARRGILLR